MFIRIIESIAIGVILTASGWAVFSWKAGYIQDQNPSMLITTSPLFIFEIYSTILIGGAANSFGYLILSRGKARIKDRVLLILGPFVGFGIWTIYTCIALIIQLNNIAFISGNLGISSVYSIENLIGYWGYICAGIALFGFSILNKSRVEQASDHNDLQLQEIRKSHD